MSVLKILSVPAFAALAALGTASAPTGAAPASPALNSPALNSPALDSPASDSPASASPLVTARTIRVREQFRLYDTKSARFTPFFTNTVLISRPSKVKVIVAQAQPGKNPHLYLADGRQGHSVFCTPIKASAA